MNKRQIYKRAATILEHGGNEFTCCAITQGPFSSMAYEVREEWEHFMESVLNTEVDALEIVYSTYKFDEEMKAFRIKLMRHMASGRKDRARALLLKGPLA